MGVTGVAGPPTGIKQARRNAFGWTWKETQGFLFVLPWLVGFVLFTAGPFFFSFFLSFTSWRLVGEIKWLGLENYVSLISGDDTRFVQSVYNTVYYVVFHVPGVLILSFAIAGLLNRKVKAMAFYRTAFYLPSITAGVATAVLWYWVLQPEGLLNNFLNVFLKPLGVAGPNWLGSTTWAMPGLIIMSFWTVGTTMILYLAGFQGIPQHLYEAAEIDGAGWLGKVRNVTIPMMTPTIFLTLVLGIIGSFQVFTAALIVTEGGPADATLFLLLYLYWNGFRFFKMGYASAIAWILFAIILFMTVVQFAVAKRWVYYEGERSAR
ncbi:MAG: sugar ABC transporter permease [Actinobacteria bacterium]|nr:sugar ABC transporter permease [Actinomycetota bacterium]